MYTICMDREIEAKFLRVDHDEIRAKLKELGAELKVPMRMVRRTVMDYPDRRLKKESAWVRLREELDGGIEVMLKKIPSNELGETFEQAVRVMDYDAAKKFLLAIGLEIKAEEESKRELWHLGDTEIMLDEWPWVDPYIEIEAPTEEVVKDLAEKLGFDWDDARFGSVIRAYEDKFGVSEDDFIAAEMTIKFDDSVPELLLQSSSK